MQWRQATPDDPLLAALHDLPARREREDVVIVEGEIAVARAIGAGWPISVVLATETAAAALPELRPGTEGRIAQPAELREIAGFDFHRGCLAVAKRPDPADASARLRAIVAAPPPWTVVLAEGLADPANVGALVRNARALGGAAVLVAGGADPFAPRAVRASMGHVFALPVVRVPNAAVGLAAIADACPSAVLVAATTSPRAIELPAFVPPACLVLMVGAEGPGLGPEALARAQVEVTIPIAPEVDSLNVAAATAILLWHVQRARA